VSGATKDVAAASTAGARTSGTTKKPRKPVVTGQRDFTGRQRLVIGTVSVVIFFALWEFVTRTFDIPTLFLPRLSEIFAALLESYRSGDLVTEAWTSINLFFWSMLLSFAIAIPLGIIVGAVDVLNRTFTTWLWAIYTSPRIVFIPLILVWAGISTTAKVIIIVISAVPPAMVVIIEGVRTVESSMLRVSRSFGASRRQTLQKIVFPASLPYVGTGVRMGVSRGLVGLFGAELFTAHSGLGFLLLDASKRYNTPLVFGILGVYLTFTIGAISASTALEKRLSRWKE
jgi:ABC-type nitrate/sulfonate/bicarbonate transport system permease component